MTEAGDDSLYFVSVHHQQFGPIDRATLMQWLQERRISATDWVWVDKAQDWYPVFIVPELSALVFHLEEKPAGPPPGASSNRRPQQRRSDAPAQR